MSDDADNVGEGNGSADSPSNRTIDTASKDADSGMSFEPVGDGTVACPPPGAASPVSSASQPPPTTISPDKTHWISIELVDEKGRPVKGEDYRITLPDGSVVEGMLNSRGRDRINGIDAGTCKVSFPNRDTKDWKKV